MTEPAKHAAFQPPIVEFRNVTFGYDAGRTVLHDVSFRVDPGQRVGLVGPSGSGKSTLVSLIARFYDPTSGVVTLDGSDIRDFTIRSLRRQIGFVLQDTQLFHATVWQNIAYGKPDATSDEIMAAARLAHAHGFIESLPQGYDTIVGQGGLAATATPAVEPAGAAALSTPPEPAPEPGVS